MSEDDHASLPRRTEVRASCHGNRSASRHISMRPMRGFTLIELLVVIAILSLLVAILIPSLNRAKYLAKNVVCMSNQHQIGIALITYTSDFRDVIAQVSESPYKGIYNGNRTMPRILADANLLPISDSRGGVWRCPLDDRDYRPLFLAYYYYYEGGPGTLPSGATFWDVIGCSYSTNGVYRFWSPRAPWSYWSSGGAWIPRYYSQAARPSNTIWVVEGSSWGTNGPSPYISYYEWITLLYWAGTHPFYVEWRRHDPNNFGPYSPMTYMDGHVQECTDYLETFTDEDYNYDEALGLEYWSFTQE